MSVCDIAPISAEEYDSWFAQHRATLLGCGPFHQPAWLRAVARGAGYRLVCLGRFAGGELVAAVPGFLVRRGPFRLFGSPLGGTLTTYLGPVALGTQRPGVLADTFLAASDFAHRRWGASYSECRTRGAFVPPPCDDPAEWTVSHRSSYAVDLTRGEANTWAALRSDCRRMLRKSERLGIEIVPYEGTAEDYRRMLVETLDRRGGEVTASAALYGVRFFRALLDELRSSGLLWALGARYEGHIIAAALVLHDDHEAHYISGASLASYRHLPTSYLLHWHVMLAAIRAGLQLYDIGEGKGTPVAIFKESFAPGHIEYVRLSRASRLVRRVKAAYWKSVRFRELFLAGWRRATTPSGVAPP